MDFALHRVELLQGQAIARGTLAVLPAGKKKAQKVAVGDDSGVLNVIYMKKGEVQSEWKSGELGREISCVVLQAGKDKLFVGCGQAIHGFTRKGKEFVKIKTNLTETIHHLFVDENMIWTGGEYIMNIYDQCKDFGFAMIKDRINAMTCAPIAPGDVLSTALACQDKCLRVYAGEKPFHELAVEGPGTALGFYGTPPTEQEQLRQAEHVSLLYGTEQGMVGLTSISAKSIKRIATISDKQQRPGMSSSNSSSRRARVSTLHTADIVKSGALDVLVGREDGSLEVWGLGDGSASPSASRLEQAPPSLTFETSLQESIQAMDSGNITGGDHNELVVTTYAGKVLAFTPSQAARDPTGTEMAILEDQSVSAGSSLMGSMLGTGSKKKPGSQAEEATTKAEKERRYKALEKEVDTLKAQLDKEKQAYSKLSNKSIAVQSTTKVSHRFGLNGEEACYVLTIDSQAPLELVALRADVDVDLLDHEGTSAILSRSKGDPTNPLLATYRMQESGSRFQIRLRTVEGLSGSISCFVLPSTNPKTAHLINLPIKPLSLHEKLSDSPKDIPLNELKLTGPFTVMDMHQWLSMCVNELPSRPTDDEMVVSYRSTFVGTVLVGRYSKGTASFKSDSIMTISVMKDLITREATARKIAFNINVDVKEETFPRFLDLIHPKLSFQHSLTQQVRMVEPLREVQLQEGETKFLSPELQQVLQQASDIQQQFELQPQRLAFLHNIVVAVYRHKWRLRGYQSVDRQVKDLQKLLDSYNKEQIAAFFEEPIR